jgi:hypothetical protein
MEQIEDLDSYSCTNSKRRITLISIREATRQQIWDRKNCYFHYIFYLHHSTKSSVINFSNPIGSTLKLPRIITSR